MLATVACLVCLVAYSGAYLKFAPRLGTSDNECEANPSAYTVGDRATCTYTRTVDVDPQRIPSEVPSVKCKCLDSVCSSRGEYRCQEVKELLPVAYYKAGSSQLANKTMEVTTACVCVASRSAPANGGKYRTENVDNEY